MKTCSVEGCDRKYTSNKMCDKHYRRWLRHGSPFTVLPKGMKRGYERPQTKKAILKPTVRDLEWAAGFLEGEGCFGRTAGSQRAGANQVNKEPVQRLLDLFGGSLKQYKKRRYAIHKSQPNPTWDWYVGGSRARGVMMTLYPLMSERRKEQLRAALA